MKRKITFLLAALLLLSGLTWAQSTLNIENYASANNWSNGTQYLTATVDDVTFTATGGGNTGKYYTNGQNWRFYQNESATLTISVPDGSSLSTITPTYSVTNNGALLYGSEVVSSGDAISVSGTSVTFSVGNTGSATNGQVRFTEIEVTYTTGGTPAPSISANNIEIAYDATEGAIDYTINDGVDGGVLSATTESEWLTIGTVGETVPFTCTVNDDGEREATVTLTYTYDTDQTVTKNVTVTQGNNPNAPGTENNPYTVAQARAAIDAGTGTQGVYATGIVSAIPTAYNPTYSNVTFNMVDEEGDEVFLQAYRCGGDEAANVAIGDVVVVYGNLIKYNTTYEFGQGCQVVSLTHPVITVPSVTVTPATVNATVEGGEGTLEVNYQNITEIVAEVFFCDAEGEAATYDWIVAEINAEDNVEYLIEENDGEARTAYLKVYALDDNAENVYSNLVTINQDEYVAPTYADLPFSFNGGRADIEGTDGLYQEGLGSDYGSAPKLKFDGTGDWLLLQFNQRPGTLTFEIKGNSFSGGTFTVQTSEDGVTYEDLAEYTELGGTETKTFDNLGENVRYIKWVYTEKSNGNVGLGNITLAEYVEPVPVASITVNPDEVNVNAEEHDGTLALAYENLTISDMTDFDIQYYDAEGEESTEPEWIEVLVAEQDPEIGEGYVVSYYMLENEGEARTAYFKVFAMDDETNLVYSNLVTINQAAYEAPVASITINPDFINLDAEMHYLEILPLTYENMEITGSGTDNFSTQFYDADGEAIATPEWCFAAVILDEADSLYKVHILTMANNGQDRSAYFKVYAYADSIPVYSNLVTINQAAPVYDYAVLPFVWEGGSSADFAALNGVTLSGNGSDYASNHAPYLIKLDSDGDFIMVKTDSQPGTVTIGVKMVGGGNTSTITVQGSADGETFTDIEVLTISGEQFDELSLETTNAFDVNDRYVKLLFTKGSNVGVGPITITKGTAPSITVTPSTFDLEAVGPVGVGNHLASMSVTYHNIEITDYTAFHVQYYDAEGEEQEQPEWIASTMVLYSEESYQAISMILANDGPARSAYLKLYAFDADSIPVYSNLVTINQAGVPQPSIIVNPDVVNVDAAQHTAQLPITYENIVVENFASFGVQFYTAEGEETETPNWLFVQATGMNEEYQVTCAIISNEGDARSAYLKMYAYTADSTRVYSNLVTINQAAYVASENWVMTNLADLMEGDVFVIVGVYDIDESSFAMPNNSTGAPSAIEVTMVGNTLSGDIDDNLKWNLSIGEDGYTFYPDGETETWLYCTNTNNGVRVGTNENNVFSMTAEGYLFNNATGRYIGIYNSQDWRCYTSINNNIKEQTFAFYKRVDGSEIETYTLDITGYGDSDGGYHLIASPVSMIRPTDDNGFLTDEYDLYYFNQSKQDFEWCNYEAKHFNIASGKGYLYASEENTTLTFTGVPYTGDGTITLTKDADASFAGWNLVGNPFSQTAYIDRDFYVMNEDGSEILTDASNGAIEAMQGFFVIAEEDGETLTFSTEAPNQSANLTMNLSQSRGAVIDRAIVRFNEGRQMPKFQLNAESTKLYIPQGNEDFAVVRSAAYGEMPVNFKAQSNGTYTISVNAENVEASYLHLIDNMTGNDIDLLQVPFYSFEATTSDYASRFRLVFNITGVEENTTGTEPFAFFNGSEWVVSNIGKATLQMVDLTGRILSSESISGNATVSTSNLSTGIYLMRLVNGNDIKVQKVVVK